MPPAPLLLDDLTWADFVAASRLDIPAASGGRWTLHAPVDPGITLVELYAWLFEQRVFWMDQVPDALTLALLKLLGVTPRPSSAATVVLAVALDFGAGSTALPPSPQVIPAESVVLPSKGIHPPAFVTVGEVTVYPMRTSPSSGRRRETPRISLLVGASDHTDDLAHGRAPHLLADDGSPTRLGLPIAATGSIPTGSLWLYFDLKTAPGIVPEWRPDACEILGPSVLSWSYSTARGRVVFPPGRVRDGTSGLRRSGIVRLKTPADWTAEPGGLESGAEFALYLQADESARPYPPRLARLIPNVLVAINRRHVAYVAAKSDFSPNPWRRLPGNKLILPLEDRPPLPETVVVKMTERKGEREWRPVLDLSAYGPEDRVFVVDVKAGQLRFGDGLNGRLPVPMSADAVKVSYSVGGGAAGNVGHNLDWKFADDSIEILHVRNVVPAEGGADAETLSDARDRAAEELKAAGRAVTRVDFETIARTTPGAALARAHAAIGRHPAHPNIVVPGAVTVFIVPDMPRTDEFPDPGTNAPFPPGPTPDQAVIDDVQNRLDAVRLITSEVFVRPPIYRGVVLDVTAQTQAPDLAATRCAVTAALQRYLDPLIGGDDNNGRPFGEAIRPSSMLRVAQAALGDGGTVSMLTVRFVEDPPSAAQGCNDLIIHADELAVLARADIHLQWPLAGRGGLR